MKPKDHSRLTQQEMHNRYFKTSTIYHLYMKNYDHEDNITMCHINLFAKKYFDLGEMLTE